MTHRRGRASGSRPSFVVEKAEVSQQLVGITELALLMGKTRGRIHQMWKENKLPQPFAMNGNRPLWEKKEAKAFADSQLARFLR